LHDLAETRKRISLHKTSKTIFAMQNGEPGGSPFLLFRFVVLAARALPREFRVSDAHRMRGVIS
jgi:hypothetical protein